MILRRALAAVQQALDRQAAVGLIGPRQVGKTTLAHALAEGTGGPGALVDHAGARAGDAAQRLAAGGRAFGQRAHDYALRRPVGRSASGAPPATAPRQHGQAFGEVTQGLRARQRTTPRAAGARGPQRIVRAPCRGRELGGLRHREPVGRRARSNTRQLLPDFGRTSMPLAYGAWPRCWWRSNALCFASMVQGARTLATAADLAVLGDVSAEVIGGAFVARDAYASRFSAASPRICRRMRSRA